MFPLTLKVMLNVAEVEVGEEAREER